MFMGNGPKEPKGSNNNSIASNGVAGNLMNSIMQNRAATNMGNMDTTKATSPLGNIQMRDQSVGGESFTAAQQMGGGISPADKEIMRNAFGEAMPRNGLFGA